MCQPEKQQNHFSNSWSVEKTLKVSAQKYRPRQEESIWKKHENKIEQRSNQEKNSAPKKQADSKPNKS